MNIQTIICLLLPHETVAAEGAIVSMADEGKTRTSFKLHTVLVTALVVLTFAASAQAQTTTATPTRFLKLLGQRLDGSTTLTVSIGPFRADVVSNASIIAAVMDSTGAIITTENTLQASLTLDSPNDGLYSRALVARFDYAHPTETKFAPVQAQNGIFTFQGFCMLGRASSSLILGITTTIATVQATNTTVRLRGGDAYSADFAKLKNGLYATAGYHTGRTATGNTIILPGALSSIVVGKPVRFNNTDSTDFNVITLITYDPFGNIATNSTAAAIFLAGGNPPLNQAFTPLLNYQRVWSDATTGIASFPDFQAWGVTSNNVQLIGIVAGNCDRCYHGVDFNTSSTVHLIASEAVGIAPVLMEDKTDTNKLVTVPSQMFVGQTAPTFRFKAVDQFGNQVSGDPVTGVGAYNGGIATISFPSPGTTRITNTGAGSQSTNDSTIIAVRLGVNPDNPIPTRQFAAKSGFTAVSERGLYTFNKFVPDLPTSQTDKTLDVLMCVSDPKLLGVPSSLNPDKPYQTFNHYNVPAFNVIPPVTTATTTFVRNPLMTVAVAVTGTIPMNVQPNPSSGRAVCTVSLPSSERIVLKVYTALGTELATIADGVFAAGEQRFEWDVSGVPSGVYLVRLQAGGIVQTAKVVVVK